MQIALLSGTQSATGSCQCESKEHRETTERNSCWKVPCARKTHTFIGIHSCPLKTNKMAKWGEGDPRWIVEERPDSTNVNNWHWYVFAEDCMARCCHVRPALCSSLNALFVAYSLT